MTSVEDKKAKKKVETDEAPALTPAVPGEPGYSWQDEYPGEKVFTYTFEDTTVGLAAISEKRQPSIGFMRSSRRKPEFEQILDMLEIVATDNALAIVDDWNATQLVKMWEKWTEWNRTTAGE